MVRKYLIVSLKNVIKIPPEFVLNNFIMQDINRMFYPFNLTSTILLSAKYTIKDNFITPNSRKYFTTVCFLTFILTMHLYSTIYAIIVENLALNFGKNRAFINILLSIHYATCLYTLYTCNITKSQSNVLLMLRIQTIHRSTCLYKNVKKHIIRNWISSVLIVCFELFIYTSIYTHNHFYTYWDYILDFMFINFDINLIYACYVLTLLSEYLVEWKNNIENMNNEEDNDMYCERILEIYQNILEAYKLFKEVFQALILLWATDTFIRPLCYMQVAIESLQTTPTRQSNAYGDAHKYMVVAVMKVLWSSKDFVFLAIFSVCCEKFYIAVEDVKSACIQLIKTPDCSESQKRLCKNMIRVNRASLTKMSACGVFTIRAVLPLLLLEVFSNYVCVLLQFALVLGQI